MNDANEFQLAQRALHTSLTRFVSPLQRAVLLELLDGEEGAYYAAAVNRINKVIADMPKTFETRGQGDEALVYLHYFGRAYEAWIIEKDMGDPDEGDARQIPAYGLAGRSGSQADAELGYVNLEELISANLELDLHWKPVTVRAVRMEGP